MNTSTTFLPRIVRLFDVSNGKVLLFIALVYLFTAKGYIEVSDTFFSLRTAESMCDRHRLDIPASPDAFLSSKTGLSYSKYGIGLAITFVPIVALSNLVGGITGLPPTELSGFFISFINVPFVLMMLILFRRLLFQFQVESRYVDLLTIALALGTICWRYAVYDFSEAMQASLLLLTFYGITGGSLTRIVMGGMAFATLLSVKLVFVVFFPVFLGYLILRKLSTTGDRTRFAIFATIPMASLGFLALTNFIRFGNAFETGYGEEARKFYLARLPETLPRLLGSMNKGLFVFSPVLVLGVIGWPGFIRRFPREAGLTVVLILGNLLLAGAWHSWVGGWCWGPRLLVPAIPLWLLPAGFAFEGRPSTRTGYKIIGIIVSLQPNSVDCVRVGRNSPFDTPEKLDFGIQPNSEAAKTGQNRPFSTLSSLNWRRWVKV